MVLRIHVYITKVLGLFHWGGGTSTYCIWYDVIVPSFGYITSLKTSMGVSPNLKVPSPVPWNNPWSSHFVGVVNAFSINFTTQTWYVILKLQQPLMSLILKFFGQFLWELLLLV